MWFVLGGIYSALVAVCQVDVKKLLAYRSVSHLNLALGACLTFGGVGVFSLVVLSLVHGLVSRALFYFGGFMSLSSRLLYFLRSAMLLVWLLVLRMNVGLPPFLSFLREVLGLVSLFLWS